MIQLILLSTLPLMVVCIIDGHILIKILLGARWEAAGTIFSWISVGGLAAGLYVSFPWLFVSQDKTGSMFRYMSAAAVVNVLSFGIGILWGAVGVAAVSGVSYLCIQTPLVMYGATRHGPVELRYDCALYSAHLLCGSGRYIGNLAPAHTWGGPGPMFWLI